MVVFSERVNIHLAALDVSLLDIEIEDLVSLVDELADLCINLV